MPVPHCLSAVAGAFYGLEVNVQEHMTLREWAEYVERQMELLKGQLCQLEMESKANMRRRKPKEKPREKLRFEKPSRVLRKGEKARKSRLDRETLKLLSIYVQGRANWKCEYPGCTRPSSEAHHVYSKEIKVVRYDEDDCIASCSYHHTMDPKTAAHRDPRYVDVLLKAGVRTYTWWGTLVEKVRQTVKFDLDYIAFHNARLTQLIEKQKRLDNE